MPPFIVLSFYGLYALARLRLADQRTRFRQHLQTHPMILAAVCLYVLALFISALHSGNQDDLILAAAAGMVLAVAHLLLPISIENRRDLVVLLRIVVGTATFCSTTALGALVVTLLTGHEVMIYPARLLYDKAHILGRMGILFVARGIFSHPNYLGMLANLALPGALFLGGEARTKAGKSLVAVCMVLCLAGVAASASFVVLPSLLLVLLFYHTASRKAVFRGLRLLVILLIVVPNVIILTRADLSLLSASPVTSPGRIFLWNSSIRVIGEHMLLGVGPVQAAKSLTGGYAAHNTFLDIALAAGIPAMMLYSCYLLLILKKLAFKNDAPLSVFALLTVLSFSVMQLFETLIFGGMSVANFFFLVIVVSCLAVKVPRSSGPEDSSRS